MTTRHEFLARLHHLLMPKLYLETGVHTGESLKLASCRAIGIDPNPQVRSTSVYATVVPMTSDDYFDADPVMPGPIDLGFIDGMHQYEFAWRDFRNIETRSHSRGVIAFDDVLPYTQGMTVREQVPGDWTGDVWKVIYLLRETRPDLSMALVDTAPCGTLLVWDLDPSFYPQEGVVHHPEWGGSDEVPAEVLFRTTSLTADQAIDRLKGWMGV